MKKKILVGFLIVLFATMFSLTYQFAAVDMVNDVKNTMGGAENVMQGTVNGITGGVKSGVEGIAGGVKSGVDTVTHSAENTMNMAKNDYSSTRTSAEGNATIGGMNTNTWIWMVVALVVIGIVALIWSYVRTNNITHHDDK